MKLGFWGVLAPMLIVGAAISSGCSKDGKTESVVEPSAPGGRGESCRARNDCRSGLACISNTCVQNEFNISPTAKSCDLVECAGDSDCCEDFVAPEPTCTTYQEQCNLGDTFYCQQYEQTCRCNQECANERCVFFTPCSTSDDCFGAGTCSDGKCQTTCSSDNDCFDGEKCVNSECVQGCAINEECPYFHACQDGQCVETGCNSDRECIGVSGNLRSTCRDGECTVPCENDGECSGQQVCEGGACVFIGCENDEECRHLLGVANDTGGLRAVCRE